MNRTVDHFFSRNIVKIVSYLFFVVVFLIAIFYINANLKYRGVKIAFLDESPENLKIDDKIRFEIRKRAGTLYQTVFLNESEILRNVRDEFPEVRDIDLSKNLNFTYSVLVSKNEPFFEVCVPEDWNFLVSCALGNDTGEFYKELDKKSGKVYDLSVSRKSLSLVFPEEGVDEIESLSGTRVWQEGDFIVLREILAWLKKNEFIVKQVEVGDLKIVKIKTTTYEIRVSLDKPFPETVKDFEVISRTGKLEKYINDNQEGVEYIDLSYKNKVFYKLKNASTTSTSTTTSEN